MALPKQFQDVKISQSYGDIPYDTTTAPGGKDSDGTYMFRVLDLNIVTNKMIEAAYLTKQVVAVLAADSKLQVGDVVKESASARMGDYYFTRVIEMAALLHGFSGAEEIAENMTQSDSDWYTPLKVQDNTVGRDSVFSQRIVTSPRMVKNNQTGEKEPKIDQETKEVIQLTKRFSKGVHTKAEVLERNPEAAKHFPEGFREDRGLFSHEKLVSSQEPQAPVQETAPAAPETAPAAPTTATSPPEPPA